MRSDQILVIGLTHGPINPKLHLNELAQMREAIDDCRQELKASAGHNRVGEGDGIRASIENLQPPQGLIERTRDRRNRVWVSASGPATLTKYSSTPALNQ